MKAAQKLLTAPVRKRNRSFGRRSPLDKLPAHVRDELALRCLGDETYAQLRAWLRKDHGLKISENAISQFAMRREEERQLRGQTVRGAESATVTTGNFEIVVTAPGASEVRVQVRSLPSITT